MLAGTFPRSDLGEKDASRFNGDEADEQGTENDEGEGLHGGILRRAKLDSFNI